MRRHRLPDRWLPISYFTLAHLCLATAFAVVAWDPYGVAGFYYHPQLIAVVHLVTLGWISGSILGALYLISPMALRTPLPARALDRWAFASFTIGTLGMTSHFWLEEPWGMTTSAALVWLAFLRVSWRLGTALKRAPMPLEVRLHFYLALGNVLLAGGLGVLLGVDKVADVLPGFVLNHVQAHAHLAALGWATLMVMAAGYRLLPMLLPAAMPSGPRVWAAAILMELGVLGLATGLYLGETWITPFGLCVLAALVLFLDRVRWMLRHPRAAPKSLKRFDFGVAHILSALVCLVGALGLGALLLLTPAAAWKLDAVMAYGTLGLVGFLAQMVVGVANRLLPLFGWLQAFSLSGFQTPPPSPHETPNHPLQGVVFGLWTFGLPLLVAGLVAHLQQVLRCGAGFLAAAVVLGLLQQWRVLRPVLRGAIPRS